jgi:hypothetical protein
METGVNAGVGDFVGKGSNQNRASSVCRGVRFVLYDEIRELVRQTTSRGEIANRPETA